MIDFHQHLTELAQLGKGKTSWKIRYRGEYLRMRSGKENWSKKSAAKSALMLEFNLYFQAFAHGCSDIKEFKTTRCDILPITCRASIKARHKTAQKELLKLVEFVELKEKEL
jgi:hypothetical protein